MNILNFVKKYSRCFQFKDGLAKVCFDNNQFCFIDKTGNEIKKDWFNNVVCDSCFSCGRLRIQSKIDDTIFYVNVNFDIVTEHFLWGEPFENGFAKIKKRDGSFTFINVDGVMLALSAKSLSNFTDDGIARITLKNNKITYITKEGRLCKYSFDNASEFSEGFAVATNVQHKQKENFCILSNELDQSMLDSCEMFDEKQTCFVLNKDFNIVSQYGLKNGINVYCEKFNSGQFSVYSEEDECYFFIDKNGEVINSVKRILSAPSEGYVAIQLSDLSENIYDIKNNRFFECDKKYYLINTQDNVCIAKDFRTGKYLFLDMHCKPISEEFDKVENFYCGLARVQLNDGKFGFIDKNGKRVLDEYYFVSAFSEDYAVVQPTEKEEYCYINKEGRYLIDFSKLTRNEIDEILKEYPEYSK